MNRAIYVLFFLLAAITMVAQDTDNHLAVNERFSGDSLLIRKWYLTPSDNQSDFFPLMLASPFDPMEEYVGVEFELCDTLAGTQPISRTPQPHTYFSFHKDLTLLTVHVWYQVLPTCGHKAIRHENKSTWHTEGNILIIKPDKSAYPKKLLTPGQQSLPDLIFRFAYRFDNHKLYLQRLPSSE